MILTARFYVSGVAILGYFRGKTGRNVLGDVTGVIRGDITGKITGGVEGLVSGNVAD